MRQQHIQSYDLLKESQIVSIPGIQTQLGQDSLQSGLTNWSSNIAALEQRANNVLCLRKYLEKNTDTLESLFAQVQENSEVFEEPTHTQKQTQTQTQWKDTTSEQIFFEKGGLGQFLNQVPGVVAFIVFMKVWLAPAFAIATPFLICILPFFMIKYVYNLPIPWNRYQSMVLDMVIGERTISLQSISKLLYFIFSLSQAIIQPFLTAIAVNKLDTLVRDRAIKLHNSYVAAYKIFEIFRTAGIKTPNLPNDSVDKSYPAFALDKDERWTTVYLGKVLGDAEVLYCLAKDLRFKKPTWVERTKGSDILLDIQDFSDISIENAKKSSILFTKKTKDSLLTGPNRGGKSSSLRGILQNVLWAQTYGLAPSTYKGQLFSWVVSSLRAEDRPGVSSLFEREIEIAVDILRREKGASADLGLVLIDEIFHSTNPPDGEKTSRIFLSQLWKMKNVVSCVSTHVYSVVEDAPKNIQKICCWAEEDEDGGIYYDYRLQGGICKVSSVYDVLYEKGLLTLPRSK